ncbi:histidine phosphatase family protein [Leucobacter ruminantium]|uniref:Histidine phosphatase family protein n=1 Tax=Leucobacter ruminantium TaxID=1289170 RepID=A0A939LXC1_9MICO|nr:histidine phosphatase family protein [Leucobacter ruminantium]MBO1806549.1 histidine phosphatase family protein [Leucobacter ruminantium]
MRIVLVRHGQTPSNVEGLLDTAAPGPGLTSLGERQAAAIPDAFRDRGIETVSVSPLLRTSLTAAPFAQSRSLDPSVHEGLREVEAGDLEMAADRDAIRTYITTIFDWVRGDEQRRMPGGESGAEFFARYDAAIEEIAATGAESAMLVSHGAAIRAWATSRVSGVDLSRVERTSMPNTGFVAIEGDPSRGWRLLEWSAHPAGGEHLAPGYVKDPTVATLARGKG